MLEEEEHPVHLGVGHVHRSEGKLNKQIAYDLSIAETTVKAHVTAIMRKLGVQSRTQAVLIAQEASFARVLPNTV